MASLALVGDPWPMSTRRGGDFSTLLCGRVRGRESSRFSEWLNISIGIDSSPLPIASTQTEKCSFSRLHCSQPPAYRYFHSKSDPLFAVRREEIFQHYSSRMLFMVWIQKETLVWKYVKSVAVQNCADPPTYENTFFYVTNVQGKYPKNKSVR